MPIPVLLAYTTTKGPIQNFTGGVARMLAQNGISRECRRAGADLDTVYQLDDSRGCRAEFRQAGTLATGSTQPAELAAAFVILADRYRATHPEPPSRSRQAFHLRPANLVWKSLRPGRNVIKVG
jgi:hypothetical protein